MKYDLFNTGIEDVWMDGKDQKIKELGANLAIAREALNEILIMINDQRWNDIEPEIEKILKKIGGA